MCDWVCLLFWIAQESEYVSGSESGIELDTPF